MKNLLLSTIATIAVAASHASAENSTTQTPVFEMYEQKAQALVANWKYTNMDGSDVKEDLTKANVTMEFKADGTGKFVWFLKEKKKTETLDFKWGSNQDGKLSVILTYEGKAIDKYFGSYKIDGKQLSLNLDKGFTAKGSFSAKKAMKGQLVKQ